MSSVVSQHEPTPSPWQATCDYVRSVWTCRYFWWSLAGSDLRTRYRRSMLGMGWSLLHPLATMTILCFVFHSLFGMDIKAYAPYLLSGLAFWGYFSLLTAQGCAAFQTAEPYIRQHPAPLAIYPIRTVLGAAFHLLITLGVVALMTGVLRGGLSWSVATLLPALVLLILFGWGISVLMAFASVHFPDVTYMTEVAVQLLFYCTPIIWPPELMRDRGLGFFVDLNPLAAMVTLIREPFLNGQPADAMTWLTACTSTALVTLLGVVVLAKFERRLIYYL